METPDYLPLSYLNQLAYCPRRFWLMFCQSEMDINAPVLDGILRHQRAHQAGQHKDEHGRTMRSVYVWSDQLREVKHRQFPARPLAAILEARIVCVVKGLRCMVLNRGDFLKNANLLTILAIYG
ncbi:MAG: hypothetical protein CUN56_13335, partial [Phototrophicales bacterium]